MNVEENPFASPQVASDPVGLSGQGGGDLSAAEDIRKAHLGREGTIKLIGVLYYLSAGFLGFSTVNSGVLFALSAREGFLPNQHMLLNPVLLAALGGFFLWLGWGLRRLRSGPRVVAIVISVIGLIGFPVGTTVSAFVLYLLCSKKGGKVFSPEYLEVIRQTPRVKCKTPIFGAILIAMFALALLCFIITQLSVSIELLSY